MAKKLVLLGWDAADWEVIHPMIEKGLMPSLKSIIEKGVSGNIATLEPVFSPMLWTSIATGKRADKHGVLGFTEPNFSSRGVNPVSTFSRKTSALWNILSHEHIKCNVVGWWPSHPVEPLNGCMVSNFYQRAVKPLEEQWPMANGTVFPNRIQKEMSSLRVHPGELTEEQLLPFVPDALMLDQDKDKRLFTVAKILSEAASIHNAGTWLMENTEWDFTAIYFDNIDHFSHAFMKYHPPKMRGIKQEDFDLFQHVIEAAYRYHDMMLGRMIDLAEDDTTFMLVSDHGFESGRNRLPGLPKEAGAPAYDHRSYGIFAAYGPDIRKDDLIYGASLLDIAPTILTAYDLPLGKDMDGKPLLNIFNEKKHVQYIESWDNHVQRTVSDIEDKVAAEESMKMLVELGYVEKPDEKAEIAFKKAKTENDFNLARVFLSSNRADEAIKILEPLFNEEISMRFGLRLVIAYEAIKEYEKAIKIIEKLEATIKRPVQQLKALKASILLQLNERAEAFKAIEGLLKKKASTPLVAQRVTKVLRSLGKYKKASNYLNRALQHFSDNSILQYLKGMQLLRQKNYEAAADSFLLSIGSQFYNPKAHYRLGESLDKMGLKEDAYRAYFVSNRQNPKRKKTMQRLAKLEADNVKVEFSDLEVISYNAKNLSDSQEEGFENRKAKFLASLEGTVYVVSGFPRSGTSMMMQMLSAGGAPIFTDKKRIADKSNPKGYYEHEGIKSLSKNKRLVLEAKDQVVKIVGPQLKFLLPRLKYKIIFMDRDLEEVIHSQLKMTGKETKDFPMNLLNHYKHQLQELETEVLNQVNVESIKISYKKTIDSPEIMAKKVADFFPEFNLDISKMYRVVEPKLYRNKT